MATQIAFRNPSLRNQLRLLTQDYVDDGKIDQKTGKPSGKKYWKTRDIVAVVKPGEYGTGYAGSDGTPMRLIIEEMHS